MAAKYTMHPKFKRSLRLTEDMYELAVDEANAITQEFGLTVTPSDVVRAALAKHLEGCGYQSAESMLHSFGERAAAGLIAANSAPAKEEGVA